MTTAPDPVAAADDAGRPDAAGFDRLSAACQADGPDAMCDELARSLAARGWWHALFDLRLVQARLALGLPTSGGLETLDEATRARLDEA